MLFKFIYCTDEKMANELTNKLILINQKTINNKKTWIFENNNKLKFSNEDLSKILFTNKLFI